MYADFGLGWGIHPQEIYYHCWRAALWACPSTKALWPSLSFVHRPCL